MPTTTRTAVSDPASEYADMADDMIADLMAGAPEQFSDPGEESPVIENITEPPVEIGVHTAPDGYVTLRNLKYVNEQIYDGNTASFRGFHEGNLVTDRATADFILKAAPHVVEEPKEGPLFTHKASGFQTRSQPLYEQYLQYYYENTLG